MNNFFCFQIVAMLTMGTVVIVPHAHMIESRSLLSATVRPAMLMLEGQKKFNVKVCWKFLKDNLQAMFRTCR